MQKTIKDRINNPLITRFIKFGIVGGSGIFVNMFLLWLGKESLGLPIAVASIIAILVSIFTNFVLNNFWTWSDDKQEKKYSFFNRMWRYYLSASFSAAINYITLIILSEYLNFYYLLANLIGIGVGMVFNFLLSEFWVFKKEFKPH